MKGQINGRGKKKQRKQNVLHVAVANTRGAACRNVILAYGRHNQHGRGNILFGNYVRLPIYKKKQISSGIKKRKPPKKGTTNPHKQRTITRVALTGVRSLDRPRRGLRGLRTYRGRAGRRRSIIINFIVLRCKLDLISSTNERKEKHRVRALC